MGKIKIDMNIPQFQNDLFNLEKSEQLAFLRAIKKIRQLNWEDLYKDSGLKWEAILSKATKNQGPIYSFRFSIKYRALATRIEDHLCLLSLHTDHDSAYT